jgi:CheY-like chemotaxis protein
MKKHVLFVDDQSNLLAGLRRMLHRCRDEWDMRFVTSGAEALARLAAAPCDVIVVDMQMPGMDGVELLAEVRRRHPRVVRVMLSGSTGRELIRQAVTVAHEYLAKPCSPQKLMETLAWACRFSDDGEAVERAGFCNPEFLEHLCSNHATASHLTETTQ